jgi:hypothetical protein
MSIQLEQATEQLTLSKEQQESLKSSSEGKNNNSLFNNADDMHNKIATKSQSSANEYKELLSKLNKRWSETRGTPKLEGEITSAIRRLIQQGERFMTNIMDTSTSEISEDTTKGEFSHELARIDNDVFKRNNNIPNANYVPID